MDYTWKRRKYPEDAWKGALAGLIGGLVGAWTMDRFQAAWTETSKLLAGRNEKDSGNASDSEDATMKVADRIATAVLRRHLTKEEKRKAGPIVHYAFGGAMGAVYGAAVEMDPGLARFEGMPFGAAVFVGADEVGVAALGLSASPFEYPASAHIYALMSHLVYGVTTETVRRVVRKRL
jgi:putative membrane protein